MVDVLQASFHWHCQGHLSHDLTSVRGLIAAVIAVLGVRCGGCVHLATVCTSFVFINSGTHGRCIAMPEGWRDLPYMVLGSTLAARSALLALLAWGLGGMSVLEQPLSSIMLALPSWQAVVRFFKEKEEEGWGSCSVKKSSVYMASFRGPTLKPTALFSSEPLEWLMNLPVPPKELRPSAGAPVAHVCFDCNMSKMVQNINQEDGNLIDLKIRWEEVKNQDAGRNLIDLKTNSFEIGIHFYTYFSWESCGSSFSHPKGVLKFVPVLELHSCQIESHWDIFLQHLQHFLIQLIRTLKHSSFQQAWMWWGSGMKMKAVVDE